MANRQLVDYIKEQVSHKMDRGALRALLLQQGWSQQDVDDAMEEAMRGARRRTHQDHHTNYVAIAVAGLVTVILAAALFIVVFNTDDDGEVDDPIIVPQPPDQKITGWAVCADLDDGEAKHSCYYDLNDEEDSYDCSAIGDSVEKSFCLRAKEAVMLERYSSS